MPRNGLAGPVASRDVAADEDIVCLAKRLGFDKEKKALRKSVA